MSRAAFHVPKGHRVGFPGRKLKRSKVQDCQSCGRSFRLAREVPYCPPCYAEKHPR